MSVLFLHSQAHFGHGPVRPVPKPNTWLVLTTMTLVVVVSLASFWQFFAKHGRNGQQQATTTETLQASISELYQVLSTNQRLDPTQKRLVENKLNIASTEIGHQNIFSANSTVNSALESIRFVRNETSQPANELEASVPILMYHHTPSDFEAHLQHLIAQGYTGITMRELGDYLYGQGSLPAKPVVITYDDGFATQLEAFAILQRYNFKATFYLILGGPASSFCIGIERTNLSCGDNYMNWSQAKQLKDSGLIDIGAHTLDHADLPTLPLEQQWLQIEQSKQRLQNVLGGEVVSFAYPYGRYNAESIELVRRAGFTTAVTTQSGTLQSTSSRYTLKRIRDPYILP